MAAPLNPDVILMDLNIRRLRELGSTARVVVTTGVDDPAMLQEARRGRPRREASDERGPARRDCLRVGGRAREAGYQRRVRRSTAVAAAASAPAVSRRRCVIARSW